jgi:hypothetical protein
MKSILFPALAAGMLTALPCAALTPTEDDFESPKLLTSAWQLSQFANAKLRQFDGRLNFIVSPETDPDEDYAFVELRNNQPGFNENWQVTLDVTNKTGNNDDTGVGFWIFNADDTRDVIFFEFYGNSTKRERKCASASFVNDGAYLTKELELKSQKITSGKLKVTFNRATKLFTFHFGTIVPKASGKGSTVDWQRMGTFSPTGIGGDARANWQMNPGSGRFGIRLEGFAEGHLIDGGKATMDNFVLKAP